MAKDKEVKILVSQIGNGFFTGEHKTDYDLLISASHIFLCNSTVGELKSKELLDDFDRDSKEDLSIESVKKALAMLGVDEMGMMATDRALLETLIEKFNGGPVGLKTIAAAISEEEATVAEVTEPYLLQLGFLERTPRGRIATKKAYEYLGFDHLDK